MFGGHAPYRLKNAVWENERNNFVDNVMNVIDDFAPGFSSQVIDMPVLLPPDLEEIIALPEGHIFHGELSLDQLFFQRSVPHFAGCRAPISGLYQCGASRHPGGGASERSASKAYPFYGRHRRNRPTAPAHDRNCGANSLHATIRQLGGAICGMSA